MNGKIRILVVSSLLVTLVLFGSFVLDMHHKNLVEDQKKKAWRLNWIPSINSLRINGTLYYVVVTNDRAVYADTDFGEAVEWAMNFTEEWGWVWKND